MNVAEAEKNFAKLVNKVYVEGVSIDLGARRQSDRAADAGQAEVAPHGW
jgi:hypothetical protein